MNRDQYIARFVGCWILILVGLALWSCSPIVRQPAPMAQQAARSSALDERTTALREAADLASLQAATESSTAAALTTAGRDSEAREHQLAAAVSRARADSLSKALAHNEAAATKAHADFAAATRAAAEETAELARGERREWDRRICWWAGALGVGAGVIAGLFARSIGLPMSMGAWLAGGGLAVAVYGEEAWIALPLMAISLLVWAFIAWHQRTALSTSTDEHSGGWQAAVTKLPAEIRTELDRLSLKAQEHTPVAKAILDHFLTKR